MLNNYASCHYVVTSTTTFCSALVDLSRSRSVHAVEHDPCCPDPTILSASQCKAVHYGLCSPLLKLPSFSIPPATPPSPLTPKGIANPLAGHPLKSASPESPTGSNSSLTNHSISSGPNSPVTLKSNHPLPLPAINGRDITSSHPLPICSASSKLGAQTSVVTRSPQTASKVDLEILDPVELLAADLEGRLEALVNTFVAQDKVRLAARKKAEGNDDKSTKSVSPQNKKTPPSSAGSADNKKSAVDNKSPLQKNAEGRYPNAVSPSAVHFNKNDELFLAQNETKQKNAILEKYANRSTRSPTGSSPMTSLAEQREFLTASPNSLEFNKDTVSSLSKCVMDLQNPSSKSPTPSILSTLKPSPEYQQTGVKAQITKFASKEKEALQNSPTNSLERRQSPKSKIQDDHTKPCNFVPGPLSLETLQELLNSPPASDLITEPIQTTVFQSSKISSVPYDGSFQFDSSLLSSNNKTLPATEPSAFKVQSYNDQLSSRESDYRNYGIVNISNNSSQNNNYSDLYDDVQPAESSGRSKFSHQDYIQSAVDYAKTRFQQSQQEQKFESKPRPKNGHLVSEAKFKWEHLPSSNSGQMWSVSPMDIQESYREALQRGPMHKRMISMEGLTETPSIPHPKLTTAQKQHIRERSLSPTDRHSLVPIRPFLTKGSVAERVLLFECCPDRALERASTGSKAKPILINTWRSGGNDVQNKTQSHYTSIIKDKNATESSSPRTSSLKRFSTSKACSKTAQIPRFYYPEGKPQSPAEIENHLQKVAAVFAGLTEGKASREEFGIITKACGLPLYWKLPLFLAARGADKKNAIGCEAFLDYWKRVVNTCHDEASKFVKIMSRGSRNYLLPEDFIPMMQDVIDSHPGLTFLKEATEFHSRYIHTVIARIYYCVNKSWSGKITVPELRKSNFLRVLATLEEEEDINQITEYFSYEHFYVIYCKFWELDKDHDLYIDQNDLKHHNGGALSSKIIERIFSGAVTGGPVHKEGKMSYSEFVWFLISEEDKRHPRSIEYWFRCMDLDGDGYLSMYELEYFYREQLQRLDSLGIETLPFTDCLCQMLDIIKPKTPGKISLSDLKKCRMTPIFFDTFFNLEKYLDHEQRDPFASQRDHDGEGPEMSDWDRFAAEEYELLVAEEGAAEQQDELLRENFDPDVDELSPNLDKLTAGKVPARSRQNPEVDDDEYDYADSDEYHY